MKKLSFAWRAGAVVTAIAIAAPLVVAQPPRAPRVGPLKVETMGTPLPDKEVQDAFVSLLLSIEGDDLANFVRDATDDFKAALTKHVFTTVVQAHSPRMEKGYTPFYLGEYKKNGYKTYVWKIVFDDKGDDLLATLSIRSNKDNKVKGYVGGLYLQ